MKALRFAKKMDKYGKMGVAALESATPVDTGETSGSWYYEIEETEGRCIIRFLNSHLEYGPRGYTVNIALLLQYGHGTRNGGYVMGRDYINPAIQPIFDKMAEEAWGEVND